MTLAALLLGLGPAAPPAFEMPAVKAQRPPVIDGVIDDAEWAGASRAADFIQYEPRRGEPSPLRTEALVLYDDRHLYVAFRAFDPEPVTAQLTQRDADLFGDDAVVVLLDASHDRQSAFYFMTNPLGTQADGRVGDDGKVRDTSWDAPWDCAAQRTAEGWTAEIRIPLASIKYVSGHKVTWGLNLGRSRRRSLEVSYWAGPLDSRDQVSQAGLLMDLDVPSPVDRWQIVPFGLSELQEGAKSGWKAGGDARFALTSQLALYGTVNPDFATIEADQETINLTRFELSLPEKRQFFLEGQELFQQRIQTFYSRRIADITAGGKLLGQAGSWTLALVDAEAKPAPAGGGRAHYSVARAQRALGRSYVAALVANVVRDGKSQGSAGIDTNLFFTKTLGLVGQVVQSYGPYRKGTLALYVRPWYDSATGHFHVRYTSLGDHFQENVNVIGFIPDDDRREADSALRRTFWIKGGALEKVAYDSNYNVTWSQRGRRRSWEIQQTIEADLRNRFSTKLSYVDGQERFEKDFRNHELRLDVGYNTRAYQSVQVGYGFGRNFDSDFRLLAVTARRKLGDKRSAEYELQRFSADPDPQGRSTWIHVLRANQSFTKELIVNHFLQTNSAIDRRNVQAVFVYRYRPPFGTVQVAYQRGTAAFGQRSDQGNTLFVKMTGVF
jgi:hypothetical protein